VYVGGVVMSKVEALDLTEGVVLPDCRHEHDGAGEETAPAQVSVIQVEQAEAPKTPGNSPVSVCVAWNRDETL
jgi:hypothetical protein